MFFYDYLAFLYKILLQKQFCIKKTLQPAERKTLTHLKQQNFLTPLISSGKIMIVEKQGPIAQLVQSRRLITAWS